MEPMAAEFLVSTAWELDGFLTRIRWPIRVHGGYSDIDVVGVNAAAVVRLAECKVRGPARAVYVVDGDFVDWLEDWVKCLENVARLWDEKPGWLPSPSQTSRVEMWYCGNIWFRTDAARRKAETRFTEVLRSECPHGLKGKAFGRIVTTGDLVVAAVSEVRKRIVDDAHGKRFGNPVLDAVRELIRYSNPRPRDGGRIGHAISSQTRAAILEALGLESDEVHE